MPMIFDPETDAHRHVRQADIDRLEAGVALLGQVLSSLLYDALSGHDTPPTALQVITKEGLRRHAEGSRDSICVRLAALGLMAREAKKTGCKL